MKTQLTQISFHFWNGYIKPFLMAALIGMMAGACFANLGHAAPSTVTRAPPEAANQTSLISSAGRIRQQAQRIAKLYQQIGMDIDATKARRQLELSRRQIGADISRLTRVAATEKSRPVLERLERSWEEMKRDSEAPFSPEARERLFIQADDLAMISGKLAMLFELNSNSPTARLLDLSLRQGMLVQRLARLYLVAYAGSNSTGLSIDIEQARREFSSALNELMDAKENSEATRRPLELAKTQWFFFEQSIVGMKTKGNIQSSPMHVASASERILEALDELSVQYAETIQAGNASAGKLAGL